MKRLLVTAALCVCALGAQTHPLQELNEAARADLTRVLELDPVLADAGAIGSQVAKPAVYVRMLN